MDVFLPNRWFILKPKHSSQKLLRWIFVHIAVRTISSLFFLSIIWLLLVSPWFIPLGTRLLSHKPASGYYYPLITSNGVKLKSNIAWLVIRVLLCTPLTDWEIDLRSVLALPGPKGSGSDLYCNTNITTQTLTFYSCQVALLCKWPHWSERKCQQSEVMILSINKQLNLAQRLQIVPLEITVDIKDRSNTVWLQKKASGSL